MYSDEFLEGYARAISDILLLIAYPQAKEKVNKEKKEKDEQMEKQQNREDEG